MGEGLVPYWSQALASYWRPASASRWKKPCLVGLLVASFAQLQKLGHDLLNQPTRLKNLMGGPMAIISWERDGTSVSGLNSHSSRLRWEAGPPTFPVLFIFSVKSIPTPLCSGKKSVGHGSQDLESWLPAWPVTPWDMCMESWICRFKDDLRCKCPGGSDRPGHLAYCTLAMEILMAKKNLLALSFLLYFGCEE